MSDKPSTGFTESPASIDIVELGRKLRGRAVVTDPNPAVSTPPGKTVKKKAKVPRRTGGPHRAANEEAGAKEGAQKRAQTRRFDKKGIVKRAVAKKGAENGGASTSGDVARFRLGPGRFHFTGLWHKAAFNYGSQKLRAGPARQAPKARRGAEGEGFTSRAGPALGSLLARWLRPPPQASANYARVHAAANIKKMTVRKGGAKGSLGRPPLAKKRSAATRSATKLATRKIGKTKRSAAGTTKTPTRAAKATRRRARRNR